jgi:hypothetical protein
MSTTRDIQSRNQRPRGLRRMPAAARFLGFWFRIPSGARISIWVLCVLCVVLVEVSATSLSLVQRIPTECGVSECDRETSTLRKGLANYGRAGQTLRMLVSNPTINFEETLSHDHGNFKE